MHKTILFILASFFSLAMILPLQISVAQAEEGMSSMDDDSGMRKRRYRYRKRTHRVQVGADITPWNQENDKNMLISLDLLYGYNAGMFEIGPNFSFMSKAGNSFAVKAIEAGLWGEFNIIKNTRKEQFVPAIGLKANYVNEGRNDNRLLLSPYLALKYFPASRTGLVMNISYDIQTKIDQLFEKMNMGINISLAYAHYFHF